MGCVDSGLTSMSWSPDEELVVLTTGGSKPSSLLKPAPGQHLLDLMDPQEAFLLSQQYMNLLQCLFYRFVFVITKHTKKSMAST